MIARGRVKGGVVVLEQSVELQEGEEVAVITLGQPHMRQELHPGEHSFADITPVDVGAILKPLTADNDLLGEMLEWRR